MDWLTVFTLTPIFIILFYIAIVGFIIWFTVKVLKNQKENNDILRNISDKLDQ